MILSLNHNKPDKLIGTQIGGKVVRGWARTNMAESGQQHIGFDTYETNIVLKFEDGTRAMVILQTKGKF